MICVLSLHCGPFMKMASGVLRMAFCLPFLSSLSFPEIVFSALRCLEKCGSCNLYHREREKARRGKCHREREREQGVGRDRSSVCEPHSQSPVHTIDIQGESLIRYLINCCMYTRKWLSQLVFVRSYHKTQCA